MADDTTCAAVRDDVKAAEQQAKASIASATVASERDRPTLDIFATVSLYGQNGDASNAFGNSFGLSTQAQTVGLRFSAPLDPWLAGRTQEGWQKERDAAEMTYQRKVFDQEQEWKDLNQRLAENEYVAGSEYTVADIAIWPWYGLMVKGQAYNAGEFLQVHEYTHLLRWAEQVAKRPAVQRGRKVNRVNGDPASQLRERHDASDFDTKTQDKIEAAAAASASSSPAR